MNQPLKKFISFPGKTHLIRTDDELLSLDFSSVTEMGFDTETRPSFRKGEVYSVALLQLATDDDAYLIRLQHVTQYHVIKNVLENRDVLKVGVSISYDLKQLQKMFKFEPQGFVELQQVAKAKGVQNMGLKGMTEEILQAALTKGPKLTNWEATILTPQQLMYAATDAWIGLTLYRALAQVPQKV